jgi:hypothetical protein
MEMMNIIKKLTDWFLPAEAPALASLWERPDDSRYGEDLPEDAVRYMHSTSQCPYCQSGQGLYRGPSGGASVNMFCGNVVECDSRFNIADPGIAPIPWGQFMGRCPSDFIDARLGQIATELSNR